MAEKDPLETGRLRALWFIATLAFRADPWRAAGSLLASGINAAAQPAVAYTTSRVIGAVLHHDTHRAAELAVILAVIGMAGLTCSLIRLDLRFRMEEATTMLIDREIIELTSGMPGLEHHERPEYLDRLELLRQEHRALGGSVGALIENFGTFASIITTTSLLASINPILLLLPAFGIPSVVSSAYSRKLYQRAQEVTAQPNRLAEHLFLLSTTGAPAKELRVFGLRDELRSRFETINASSAKEFDRTTMRATLVSTAGWAVFAVGYIGAILYVANEAVAGRVGAEQVILVVSLASQVNQQVGGVYWMVGWLFDTLKTVNRYIRLRTDAALAMPDAAEPVAAPERLTQGIDLVDVTFRYPGTEVDILSHVDLHIPAGTTVAVVGDNGAGKSTLVKLLSRFYDPTSGSVLVDGTDLRRIPVREWRTRMSAGFQDFAKLELIARETVGVGHLPDMEDAALVGAALDRASASDVTEGLADGLETQVGRTFDGGLELSGGQWQKLALGRAMMRERPLLLVLDEPTAALDADTEHALFQRYAGAAREVADNTGGITVLVSHRFSTVRMADVIVVIGDGGVAECGTHAELMAAGGTYAELYELQARAYR
ncbi:MAG TPA: ABC transporter ATP-binding protein [Acidimicrobiales bacterium]|nr:ABC transporter ATP-binding protein [Acidimicrobiales bacterium]